jgi:DNA-binding SARP family transcriptional activator
MESRNSPRQDAIPLALDKVVQQPLLSQGLESIRRGNFDEGISLLALARKQLEPEQMHLASILDEITEGYTVYCLAQDALLQAVRSFAKADSEQQTRLATLNKLLSASEEAINTGQCAEIQPGESSQLDQSPQDGGSHQSLVPSRPPSHTFDTLPGLYVTCFGRFEVYRDSQQVELCANRNGQTILRYLVAQPDHCATADRLMGILWPEDEQEVAHHKVHVAISALRGSLNRGYECTPGDGYILSKNRIYQINPAISLKIDVDEFLKLYQAGLCTSGHEMATLYEKACHLYMGPFLVEDTYADWSFIRREHLSQTYLIMCHTLADHFLSTGRYKDTVKWANTILEENRCDEAAYRQLMQAYAAQGRRSEALRQYQRCEHVLRDELGVSPMPETLHVFQAILMRKQISNNVAEIERK